MRQSQLNSSPKARAYWRQVSIHGVLTLTLVSATFASGYQSGYEQSEEYLFIRSFDELLKLINDTQVPATWEMVGNPSTMDPYAISVHEINGCYAEVVDHMANGELKPESQVKKDCEAPK